VHNHGKLDQQPPLRDVSPGRRSAYYAGMVLIVLGFLLFLSNFFNTGVSAPAPGQPSFSPSMGGILSRALGGMALIVIGSFLMRAGKAGLAGSGILLDPRRARQDLEPFSRQAGGMLHDALDEAGLSPSRTDQVTVVKVRCRACTHLNPDNAKFCSHCGQAL
jgi:hypothetical protein